MMKANPGGEIAPCNVVGRDRKIAELWDVLERQSIVVVAERRMGKTTVLKKMRDEKPEDVLLLFCDVEGIGSPIEFVERVTSDLEVHLSLCQRGLTRLRKFCRHLEGAEIGSMKFPAAVAADWKSLLECAAENLADQLDGTQCIFIWDELPLMIQKICKKSGPDEAMEVLDILRNLRQTHSTLRMVFSGSIGLHHIEAVLREAGHNNDATNDMLTIEIPPLEEADGIYLARELLIGENLEVSDLNATAKCIAEQVDFIPYYIHHVVDTLKVRGKPASQDAVCQIVTEALGSSQNNWHLMHYKERLKHYYGDDRLPVVLKVLDEVAIVDEPVRFKTLFESIKSTLSPHLSEFTGRMVHGDEELLHEMLDLMQRDHYLQLGRAGYRFQFNMIKRWWYIHRNLVA